MKSKKPGVKKKKQQKERGGSYHQKSTKGETCFNCGAKPICLQVQRGGDVNELQTQPTDAPSNEDSTAEDYTQVYFTAAEHYLKTVMAKNLNHSHSLPHIRPL
ncbi:unnamed protein product [Porites lobata]|uniref:Uncharacterized protein n=1 Tax=Porites lobata TaxID=104759 RepID=A0ABN8N6B6_9CNID|nr:unnamed protein product [Porites lobata]